MNDFKQELIELITRHKLDQVFNLPGPALAEFIAASLKALGELSNSGEGAPSPEQHPGPGYRTAELTDKDRPDLELWTGAEWTTRSTSMVGVTIKHLSYFRVPVDVIPNNDDLRKVPRPWVMVRDNHEVAWRKRRLVSISPGAERQFVCEGNIDPDETGSWMYARHLRSYES
jgi:hypothetical protein